MDGSLTLDTPTATSLALPFRACPGSGPRPTARRRQAGGPRPAQRRRCSCTSARAAHHLLSGGPFRHPLSRPLRACQQPLTGWARSTLPRRSPCSRLRVVTRPRRQCPPRPQSLLGTRPTLPALTSLLPLLRWLALELALAPTRLRRSETSRWPVRGSRASRLAWAALTPLATRGAPSLLQPGLNRCAGLRSTLEYPWSPRMPGLTNRSSNSSSSSILTAGRTRRHGASTTSIPDQARPAQGRKQGAAGPLVPYPSPPRLPAGRSQLCLPSPPLRFVVPLPSTRASEVGSMRSHHTLFFTPFSWAGISRPLRHCNFMSPHCIARWPAHWLPAGRRPDPPFQR
mmetsp:Transcript_15580/g.59121  ORF Transcript_15580/g.59121 Transcript_15580/m.59121 type:complete len:342 (+) Transcript_15580:1211-2236(+)